MRSSKRERGEINLLILLFVWLPVWLYLSSLASSMSERLIDIQTFLGFGTYYYPWPIDFLLLLVGGGVEQAIVLGMLSVVPASWSLSYRRAISVIGAVVILWPFLGIGLVPPFGVLPQMSWTDMTIMAVAFYGPPIGTLSVYGLAVHWLYERPRPRMLCVLRWTLGSCLAAVAVLIVLFDLAVLGVHVPGQANTKSVYLLPDHFVGPVIVLFGQPDGMVPVRKGNTQVYTVPSSGIVRVQSAPNHSGAMPSYFYVDRAGHRTRIPVGSPWNISLPDSQLQVKDMLQMDTTGGGTRFDARYRVSIVGRKIDFPLLQERAHRLFDSLEKNESWKQKNHSM